MNPTDLQNAAAAAIVALAPVTAREARECAGNIVGVVVCDAAAVKEGLMPASEAADPRQVALEALQTRAAEKGYGPTWPADPNLQRAIADAVAAAIKLRASRP